VENCHSNAEAINFVDGRRQKGPLFCHAMGIILHKISSLYAPSEIASQFPPPLRSNNCELPVDIIIAMWF
jgi:hypothetical protein